MPRRKDKMKDKICLGFWFGLMCATNSIIIISPIRKYFSFHLNCSHQDSLVTLNSFLVFLITVITFPFLEELLYRKLAIKFSRYFFNNYYVQWIAIIFLSAIVFGWIHGSWHHIIIQGPTGLVFLLTFLYGGLLSSTIAHSIYNLIWFIFYRI